MNNQKKLNYRQLKFVELYLTTGMSLAEAYKSAGYKPRSDYDASSKARKLLEDSRVKAEIDRRLEESNEKKRERLRALVPQARDILQRTGELKNR